MKLIGVLLARGTVNAIGRDQQIAIRAQGIKVSNLGPEKQFYTQLFTAPLQNLEKLKPLNSRKAITMDGNLIVTMDHINVVPGRETSRNFRVRFLVGCVQVCECLS